MTSIFILVLNNGESYEDKDHWNSGIYSSLETAKQEGFKRLNSKVFYFEVEEWNINGKVKEYYFEK